MDKRGKFISFEGIDGAGKSSHIAWLAEELGNRGIRVVRTREPGGTLLGEKLRELLLAEQMVPATESLLVFAARQEHLSKVIQPALREGHWVLCDRFNDATFAYQGFGRGFSLEKLAQVEQWMEGNVDPDLTIIFDCSPEVAAQRLATTRDVADKFERESIEFFNRVRSGYRTRASLAPYRYHMVDSERSISEVRSNLRLALRSVLV